MRIMIYFLINHKFFETDKKITHMFFRLAAKIMNIIHPKK